MLGLTIQCPHCLHLVQLGTGYLENSTVCFDCGDCGAIIALPYKEKVASRIPLELKPHPVSLPQTSSIPHIPASDLQAIAPENTSLPQKSCHPLPKPLAKQIAEIEPNRPGSTGIKNAFCRLWEEQWDDSTAHENFLQKANHQNALPVAGQLYGAVLQRFPDDKRAGAAREKILNLGLLQLGHMRGNSSITSRKVSTKKALWGIGLILGLSLLTFIFSNMSQIMSNSASLAK